jgi:hypothetical protein
LNNLYADRRHFVYSRNFTGIFAMASILVVLSLAALGLTGCSSPEKIPGTSAQIETGSGYSIQVFHGETQTESLTLAALSKLDTVKFTADGKNEQGPTLKSALALVGITSFDEITVYGFSKGRLATAEKTLEWSQINDKVILDFSNQGTCKLAGADIPSNDWIIDVTRMVVK